MTSALALNPPPRLARTAAVALLLVVTVGTVFTAGTARAVGGSEFVRITNQYRAGEGLPPVSLHGGVDAIAVERANQMAARREMFHDLDYVKQRLGQMGVCWSNVGEIIAYDTGYPTHSYERTMGQWWKSPGHHAIIVGNFDAAGGSWATAGSTTYSVMIFIKTCGSSTTIKVATIGRAVLAAGSHTGYQFSGSSVIASKTARLSATSGAGVAERKKINGKVYLRIVNGIWAGYWIPETYRSYLPGIFDRVTYPSPIRLVLAEGKHVGFKYYSSGNYYARLEATLVRRSGAHAVSWAIINGKAHFLVIDGMWAGYWLPDKAGIWPAP